MVRHLSLTFDDGDFEKLEETKEEILGANSWEEAVNKAFEEVREPKEEEE